MGHVENVHEGCSFATAVYSRGYCWGGGGGSRTIPVIKKRNRSPKPLRSPIILLRTPRVQVPNNHILTQDLHYKYYYPNPKYLIIIYMDPLGKSVRIKAEP